MGQLIEEETKPEVREEIKHEESVEKQSNISSDSAVSIDNEDLVTAFSNITISKDSMTAVPLGEGPDTDSDSEPEQENECKGLRRGPTNGVAVRPIINQCFTFSELKDNNCKRTCDHSEDPCFKYQRPVHLPHALTEKWLNNSFNVINGETELAQNLPYALSEDSSSSIDYENDVLADLMDIVDADKNKLSNSNTENLRCSSKDSKINIIKKTLQYGYDTSPKHIFENNCLEYHEIKNNKASPPPQCVPQLYDLNCSSSEIEPPTIATEFESDNQILFKQHLTSDLKNNRQILMNQYTQEQLLLNSVQQNSTTGKSNSINGFPFMRNEHNFSNFCKEEQTALNDCNQMLPARNAGNERPDIMNIGMNNYTQMNSGFPMLGMHNYGNQGQILMNGVTGQQQPINAGSRRQNAVSTDFQGQAEMNTGRSGQTIMNARNIAKNAISTGNPIQTIPNVGSPIQTLSNVGSPIHTLSNVGSPIHTLSNVGSPIHTLSNVGSPIHTLPNVGSPIHTLPNVGSPNQTLPNVGSPNQTLSNVGSPNQTLSNVGSPNQTLSNVGSPSQTLPNAASPSQTFPNAGSPSQTFSDYGSPSLTIMNDDEQEQIIMNATTQAQMINNGSQNWINSLEGQNLSSVSAPCPSNANKAPLIHSQRAELVGQGGQVYSSPSQHMLKGTTPNLQNPSVSQPTAVSSTPVIVSPFYLMSTSNTLILVQKPQSNKSSPKPILPKPPASEGKPAVLDEKFFSKPFNTTKKGKNIFNTDVNAPKSGASHQQIARRCVASRTDEELLSVDADGNNYLHAAVCVTDVNMVIALLERIRRMEKLHIINDCNLINQTPLYLAVSKNKPAVVCELVRNNANPNILAEVKINEKQKKRRSALHCAATQGKDFNLTLKQLFESKKIDPNIKNCDGLTPLISAIIEHGKIVSKNNKNLTIDNCLNASLLLKNGANPEICDGRNGMTPLMYAIESKDINLVEAITKNVDDVKLRKMLSVKTLAGRTCSKIVEELQTRYEPAVYRRLTSVLSHNSF